jgi:excinuclease ABC subunit C
MESEGDAPLEELRTAFLMQYYGNNDVEIPRTILLDDACTDAESVMELLSKKTHHKIEVSVPQRGEKKRLTEMAKHNCTDLLAKNAELRIRAWERDEGALLELAKALDMDTPPTRIECYDNSHLFGTNTVSSMVVFTNGKPDKQEYRHYRIHTVNDGDDIEAMREVLTRRFTKGEKLPDLLLLDGGQTQLAVGEEVLRETDHEDVPVAALAESEEWLYLPDREDPIILPRSSASLHLVQRIRDEAHRFAITYHRNLRSKSALFSQLDNIPGIGDKRKHALFDAFLTVDGIKAASLAELVAARGMNEPSAKAIYDYFHPDQQDEKEQV